MRKLPITRLTESTTTKSTAAHPIRSRRRKLGKALLIFFFAQLSTACFTLNVNVSLPEAAVQRATDDYVRELYRAKEKGKSGAADATPVASPSPATSRLELAFLPSAQADEDVRMKLDSSKARRIFARLKSRVPEIVEAKKAGTLGESNEGKLVLRGAEKLKLAEKSKLQTLISDENSDRADLYDEALKSNHLEKSKMADIEKSFTRSFQTVSPSGTWIQDMDGHWLQKP